MPPLRGRGATTTGASNRWRQLWPSLISALAVVALFAAALWVAREFEGTIRTALRGHALLAAAAFFVTSSMAVLVPVLSNLPLVPAVVLVLGPGWTAFTLLAGWVFGATVSFMLGRQASDAVQRLFPAVRRHADVERLIHPQHRILSLALLRATFPVDVLSYALGLFSRPTTALEVALSTAIGAAPFAAIFACLPLLDPLWQLGLLSSSVIAFVAYAHWMLARQGQVDRPAC